MRAVEVHGPIAEAKQAYAALFAHVVQQFDIGFQSFQITLEFDLSNSVYHLTLDLGGHGGGH